MKLTIVHKSINKSIQFRNPKFIPRVGDHIHMGFEPVSKVIKVLWKEFPNFDDILVLVD